MTKKIIASMFVFMGLVCMGAQSVSAQMATNTAEVSIVQTAEIKQVGFFDRVKLLFTFNTEKKINLLQDFSKRSFALATENFEQGDTIQGEILLQQSETDMSRANVLVSKIDNEEKRSQARAQISSENSSRVAVLTAVQARIESPLAQEALGRAITRQQVMVDVAVAGNADANQNVGNRTDNGISLGSTVGISAVNPACTPTTTPYIKVTSPNGGESYSNTDELEVEWESCNIASSATLAVKLLYNTDGIMVAFVPNTGSHTFQLSPVALMNPPVSPSQPVTYGQYFKAYVGTPPTTFPSYQDWSDNFFKITEGSSTPGVSVSANLGISANNNLLSGGQFSCPGISISSPQSNAQVAFPLTVQGIIHPTSNPGPWGVFEGEAGHVVIKDGNGNVKSNAVILALSGEWMNSNPKPFSVIIPSLTESPYSSEGFLHFSDNNPMDGAIPRVCDMPVIIQ